MGDKIAQLELPYGLEGQVTLKNLKKEDGSNASEGETLEFKVLEFSKDDKRILLSHSAVWNKDAEQPKAKKGGPKKGNTLDKINQEVEKSTLGDLDALSALKNKMEGGAAEEAPKAKKAAASKAKKSADEEEEK